MRVKINFALYNQERIYSYRRLLACASSQPWGACPEPATAGRSALRACAERSRGMANLQPCNRSKSRRHACMIPRSPARWWFRRAQPYTKR